MDTTRKWVVFAPPEGMVRKQGGSGNEVILLASPLRAIESLLRKGARPSAWGKPLIPTLICSSQGM